jgi:alanyl-tRNA synthetase
MAVHPAVGVLALGVDAPKGKAMAIAALPAGLVSQGVSAVEWVSAACFGKGGGKPNNAQTGVAADKADEVLKAAWDAAIKFTAKLTPAAAAAAHVDPAQK